MFMGLTEVATESHFKVCFRCVYLPPILSASEIDKFYECANNWYDKLCVETQYRYNYSRR